MSVIILAIHGGAGTILRENMTPVLEAAYQQALQRALDKGYSVLEKRGTAPDAVEAAVKELEDEPLFNAGRGSVFTYKGEHEMDAAIMDGSNGLAGAVAGVRNIRNPIELARAVMQHTEHVFLAGTGAEELARALGIPEAPPEYFFSEQRQEQWKLAQQSGQTALDHNIQVKDRKFGTVGAVACDHLGNVAAATSTGGMTNKRWGRIGDSPVIGSGTYANNNTCAISCTGHGELFIRAIAAYDVSCLMEYKGLSLEEAMRIVVMEKLVKIGGEGGMIGVDAKGNASLLFNSEGMYRGVKSSSGLTETAIYR